MNTDLHLSRQRLSAVFWLAVASCLCIGILAARMVYMHDTSYRFMLWNLFLAWIPLVCALAAERMRSTAAALVCGVAWLVFLPNAPYMLTDLQDLARGAGREAPLWYDVIIVVWCSWTGTLLGVISLYLMQDIIIRTFNRWLGWVFVFVISGLSSFGIYIGRFVRLNSWDILQNPTETAVEILGIVIDPSRRLAAFTLLYTVFFLFIFLLLYSFSHMLQEQAARANSSPERLASTQPTQAQG